jgi:hypothetical protein
MMSNVITEFFVVCICEKEHALSMILKYKKNKKEHQ